MLGVDLGVPEASTDDICAAMDWPADSLLDHLATMPRNQVRFAGATTTVPMLGESTGTQREAFDLIGVPIPLALK